ncbi:uncharacterized protein RAG0_14749 [Rhynchosporium agropyri]|uniref:Uncharacterized protein n=1 Tax=Rhynchosporium agropyri TaxID=914238 RepID=A0A1E1LI57_9HELO|nr:uncharacterized protein RAG0_14749 [Rhynchosporium agropyri]
MGRLMISLFLASGFISSLVTGVPTDKASESLTARDSIEERAQLACDATTRCCARTNDVGSLGACVCHSAGWQEPSGTVCCKTST